MRTIMVVLTFLMSFADSSRAELLSLKQAVSLAMENNNLVRAARYTAEAARHGVEITNARYFPLVSLEEALVVSNSPTQTFMMKLDEGRITQNDFQIGKLNNPGTHHDFRTAITLQQPVFDPSLGPAKEIARKESERQTYSLYAVQEETAFRIFRQYLEIRKSKARVLVVEQAIAEAKENLRLSKVRTDSGVGLKSDELRAKTHLSSVEQQLVSAGNDLILARLRLADSIGRTSGDGCDIAEISSFQNSSVPQDELEKIALVNRVDLRQSRAEVEKSDAGLRLARSAYLPSLSAIASYQMNAKDIPFGADNDAWFAGVSMKWQLFDGFRRYREHDRANAIRFASTEHLENLNREIRYQVKESVLRRDEMGKRLEVARNAVVDAEETVRLLTRRFENSLATLVELLDAQTALNQVRASLVESENNYILASGAIYYAAGIFMKEIVK